MRQEPLIEPGPRAPARTAPTPRPEVRCRRCDEPIATPEHEVFFARTGLCFWCAYVDSQG